MSSDDDYGYDDDEDNAGEDEDDDDQAYQTDQEVDDVKKVDTFAVLTVEEIRKRQNDDVCTICSVLSVPREAAISLLLYFNWNVNTAHDEWFADEERIWKSIGLLSGTTVVVLPKSSTQNTLLCKICLEDLDIDQMHAAVCGHLFCIICWNSYISIAINDGLSCLTLRCPDPSCSVLIGEDMIKLVSIENQKKYKNYLLRSYIENSKNLKWCPAPNCDNTIKYELGSDDFDVECNCSYNFCWNCLEEVHRPVDCETVAKWNHKNSKEGKNTEWILQNSKPCPKCKKPIEKNQGCMHMTCRAPCRHEFCWLCLNPWKEHGRSFYLCNKYETEKQTGNINEEEVRRLAAKEYVDRYTHFYERWAANEESRKKSVVHLKGLKNGKHQYISDVQEVFITDIEYILKAWEQIIECRRVLKWAYAYGYYIEEEAKKRFFEFTQGDAEAALERLHQCAEEEVVAYANADGPLPDFIKLKEKLTTMTEVTRNYFDRLVKALENDLADVVYKI